MPSVQYLLWAGRMQLSASAASTAGVAASSSGDLLEFNFYR